MSVSDWWNPPSVWRAWEEMFLLIIPVYRSMIRNRSRTLEIHFEKKPTSDSHVHVLKKPEETLDSEKIKTLNNVSCVFCSLVSTYDSFLSNRWKLNALKTVLFRQINSDFTTYQRNIGIFSPRVWRVRINSHFVAFVWTRGENKASVMTTNHKKIFFRWRIISTNFRF